LGPEVSQILEILDLGIFHRFLPVEHPLSKNPKSNMLQNQELLLVFKKFWILEHFRVHRLGVHNTTYRITEHTALHYE
jgi:hypothetical protein